MFRGPRLWPVTNLLVSVLVGCSMANCPPATSFHWQSDRGFTGFTGNEEKKCVSPGPGRPGAARDQGPGAVFVPERYSRMPLHLRLLRFLLFKFFNGILSPRLCGFA